MRRLACVVIAIIFIASTIPAFAADASCSQKCTIKLPFQTIADTMKSGKVKPRNELRPLKAQKPIGFQNFFDEVKEGAKVAKGESLRTKK